MAGRAELVPNSELRPESVEPEVDAVKKKAAELYGSGWKRREIARMLLKWLQPRTDLRQEDRLRDARRKLLRWEKQQAFRDLIWDTAVVELDMSTPEILAGVKNKAKRGRVDAAKLALSITGRHVEKAQDQPGHITINLGVARPASRLSEPMASDITIDAVEE